MPPATVGLWFFCLFFRDGEGSGLCWESSKPDWKVGRTRLPWTGRTKRRRVKCNMHLGKGGAQKVHDAAAGSIAQILGTVRARVVPHGVQGEPDVDLVRGITLGHQQNATGLVVVFSSLAERQCRLSQKEPHTFFPSRLIDLSLSLTFGKARLCSKILLSLFFSLSKCQTST